MKIKRPSLKGMKNTKYLGHFAQDKYIQKGHNLSGVFDVKRPASAIEMMAPSNPYSSSQERQRRMQQAGLNEQTLAALPSYQQAESELSASEAALSNLMANQSNVSEEDAGQYNESVWQATRRRDAAQQSAYRGRKKKFVEEV
jgi:hypothetical protein